MATAIISHENEVIAESVIPFLRTSALNPHDSTYQAQILETLFNRYVQYFAQEPLELNDFSEDILKTIMKIQQANSSLFDELIVQKCSEASEDTFDLIAAICHVLQQVRGNSHTAEIVNAFSFLLEAVPVPCERLLYLALTQYVEFVCKKYKEEVPQAQFDTIIQHAICPDTPEEYAPMFVSLIMTMLKQKVVVSEDIPPALIGTENLKYISIAAKMIRNVQPLESQQNCFSQCIEALSSVEGYLEFIESLPQAKTPQDISLAQELVGQFIETTINEASESSITPLKITLIVLVAVLGVAVVVVVIFFIIPMFCKSYKRRRTILDNTEEIRNKLVHEQEDNLDDITV